MYVMYSCPRTCYSHKRSCCHQKHTKGYKQRQRPFVHNIGLYGMALWYVSNIAKKGRKDGGNHASMSFLS